MYTITRKKAKVGKRVEVEGATLTVTKVFPRKGVAFVEIERPGAKGWHAMAVIED